MVFEVSLLPGLQHKLIGIGLLVWIALAALQARRLKVWWPFSAVTLAFMLAGGALGGRFYAVLGGHVETPWYQVLSPGYSSIGLVLGAAVGLMLASLVSRVPLPTLADVMVPGALAALGLARLGCLFRGCDFGSASSAWGVVYLPGSEPFLQHLRSGAIDLQAPYSAVVHAFPIYLAAAAFAGAAAGFLLGRGRGGAVLGVAVYLLIRGFAEPFRFRDGFAGFQNPETIVVWVLALVAVATALFWRRGST